jgi:hypothetical protein
MELQSMYDQLMESVNEIDVKLDSRTDGKSAGKRTIVSNLIDDTKADHEHLVQQFIDQLSAVDEARMAGIYYGITRGLSKAFDEKAAAYVNALVENVPTPEPLCTEEEAKELSDLRSKIYQKVKKLIELAEAFGGDHGFVMPRRRTGATGKRGPRATSFITWTIDDTEYDTLKDVAEKYSAHYEKVKDLTAAIKGAGINLTAPPAEFTFDLPDGKILVGSYEPPADDDGVDEIYGSED